jgi:hypothetical protein
MDTLPGGKPLKSVHAYFICQFGFIQAFGMISFAI